MDEKPAPVLHSHSLAWTAIGSPAASGRTARAEAAGWRIPLATPMKKGSRRALRTEAGRRVATIYRLRWLTCTVSGRPRLAVGCPLERGVGLPAWPENMCLSGAPFTAMGRPSGYSLGHGPSMPAQAERANGCIGQVARQLAVPGRTERRRSRRPTN